jgi:hypothetical protein
MLWENLSAAIAWGTKTPGSPVACTPVCIA